MASLFLCKITMFLISLCIVLTGCQNKEEPSPPAQTTLFSSNVMTIDYRIIIGEALSLEKKKSIDAIVQSTFEFINLIYNKWNPDSELSRLNRLQAGVFATISPDLEQFLWETQQIVELSGGRFDPTIEPLQRLWKEKLASGQAPSNAEINAILPAIGWNKIHFGDGLFYKEHHLTMLDLSGIAKGYCVDLLVERLNAAGYPNVYVEWGGEIRASGHHPNNRPWQVFISRLGDANPNTAVSHVGLINQAIATSGDYLQNWSLGQEDPKYFHIFDPQTGYPLTITDKSIASASVLAPTCAFADGLATALMTFPSVEAAESWASAVRETFPATEFWIISRNIK